MSILRDIKILHLEPTDVCQLACPLCARETDTEFDKTTQHHLTVEQIQTHLSVDQIKKLDKLLVCGDYGDPAAGKHTLDIFQWIRSVNPDIVLGMNTNGALQNVEWWQKIAAVMTQPKDYIVFSIDGLEDTNHLYRINCNWTKLMANVSAFINAGGSAHWDMLVYQHNQHQVHQAQQLAKDMGFKWFRNKVSKRPFINQLEFPVGWLRPKELTGPIRCHALDEQSIYIDAQGRMSPCCWLGSRQSKFVTDFTEVIASWNTDEPNTVCKSVCSTGASGTNFSRQWQKEIQL